MPPEDPDVSAPGDRLCDLLVCAVDVEVLVLRGRLDLQVDLQIVQLVLGETCHREVHAFEADLFQDAHQLDGIPSAIDLVQSHVQSLLFDLAAGIDHDIGLFPSEVEQGIVSLVASDDGAVLVDQDRLRVAESLDARHQILELLVLRSERHSRVVFCRKQVGEPPPLHSQFTLHSDSHLLGLRNEIQELFLILSRKKSDLPRPAFLSPHRSTCGSKPTEAEKK